MDGKELESADEPTEEDTEGLSKEIELATIGLENEGLKAELQDCKEKFMRHYAEFENYKKRSSRDKEEIAKYANESFIVELLPQIDHLEIALKHTGADAPRGLVEGVEMTLKSILKVFEKFGVVAIESSGLPFNPEFHHAISQIERADMDDGTVVEEFRKGYLYNGKVIRASMVSVSKRPQNPDEVKIDIEEQE